MVSIIMPAYNASRTIKESINSVITQTVKDWELIVIDDCSSDNTTEIISEFVEKDNRIKFLKNDRNRGVSYTRNRAIELATGEWIAFLDSDDRWMSEKLEKQLALSDKYPDMIICYTASSFVDDSGKPYDYVMPAVEQLDYKILLRKNLISCSSVMIRSSVMKEIKMPSDSMHEDYFVWLTVVRKCGIAHGIDEPLLVYRMGANSKSSNRLKSAEMLFKSYRAVGYSSIVSCFFVFRYSFHSISKRKKIHSK